MGHCIASDECELIFSGIPSNFWDESEEFALKKGSSGGSSPAPPQLCASKDAPSREQVPSRAGDTDLCVEQASNVMPSTAQLEGPQRKHLMTSNQSHEEQYTVPVESTSKDPTKTALLPPTGTRLDEHRVTLAASSKSQQSSSSDSSKTQNSCPWLPRKVPVSLPLENIESTAIAEFTAAALASSPLRSPRDQTPLQSSPGTCQTKCPLSPTKSSYPPHSAAQHTNNKSSPVPSISNTKLQCGAESGKENTDPRPPPNATAEAAKDEASAPYLIYSPVQILESETWWQLGFRVMKVLPGRLGPAWYNSHLGLLHCDNTLPMVWRHYIALLAMCRHDVPWATRLLALEFLKAGGHSMWLTCYKHAPAKLQRLLKLNTLLAHQPWALTALHLQELCCEHSEDGTTWSYSEAMLAVLLLSHHHAFAGFLLCCPLMLPPPVSLASPAPVTVTSPKRATSDEDYPESEEEEDPAGLESFIDLTVNLTSATSSVCSSLSSSPSKGSLLTVCSGPTLPSSVTNGGGISSSTRTASIDNLQQHLLPTNGVKMARFGSEKSVSSRPSSPVLPSSTTANSPVSAASASKPTTGALHATARSGSHRPPSPEEGHSRPSSALFPGLVTDPDVGYKHFPHHLSDENSPCISGNSFRWIDYGFTSTRRLLNEEVVPTELDDRFAESSWLAHRTGVCGERLLEPRINGPCYIPVWRQVEWLLGVIHDDYDYSLLRRTMPRKLQHLVRTATCFPKRLSSLPRPDLQQHEMVAVCAQIMDVRMQCEVMFAVRAIAQCYTRNRMH